MTPPGSVGRSTSSPSAVPEHAGSAGDLAIVLHSHMPYVEGFGTYPFGEEWLFDAVARSYAAVLEVADRVTVTVTPVLADQLEAEGVAERLERFIRELRLGAAEADAGDVGAELRPACLAEAGRYRAAADRIERASGDLLGLFREPAEAGRVALMTSSATHAVLPLLATPAGRRLQVELGMASHRRRFGEPAGFWLPECAYEPGLEGLLAAAGAKLFCADQSAHEAPLDALEPAATQAGPVAATIDWEAVSWLWSLDGYPAAAAHADFHRKSMRGCRPWAIGGGAYDPEAAAALARTQAGKFLDAAAERLERFARERDERGLLTFAIDTELLGHWWWEGPEWLAEVIRLAPSRGVRMLTLPEALAEREPAERPLRRASWGDCKDLRTWDSPEVADLAWAARRLELRAVRTVASDQVPRAACERAVRELLALQASDWAFLDGRRQAGDYPYQRATAHARRLLDALDSGAPAPNPRLRSLAPDLSLVPLLEP
jgi:1,4-alpha-glucan branching enzyme